MRTSSLPILVVLLIAVTLITVNVFVLEGKFDGVLLWPLRAPATALFEHTRFLRRTVTSIKDWREVWNENQRLKERVTALESILGRAQEIERENEALRSLERLADRRRYQITSAGMTAVVRNGQGYGGTLNEGSAGGITVGATVATPQGALVGIVKSVGIETSRVQIVFDPQFEVTGAVLGSQTVGIARGAGSEGMFLDLIVQGEVVREGDTIMSTGSDAVPAGLVIGEVEHVQEQETQLFKKVRLQPAFHDAFIGPVIVLQRQQ